MMFKMALVKKAIMKKLLKTKNKMLNNNQTKVRQKVIIKEEGKLI